MPSIPPEPPVAPEAVAEIGNLNPDGTRSLDSALRLFAMAYGPIPGVDPSVTQVNVGDAYEATKWLAVHDAELTAEQRTAIAGYLDTTNAIHTFDVPPAATGSLDDVILAAIDVGLPLRRAAGDRNRFDVSFDSTHDLDTWTTIFRKYYAEKMGHDYPGDITVVIKDPPFNPKCNCIAAAETEATYKNGSPTKCSITFAPSQSTLLFGISTLAHEVFHCFQQTFATTIHDAYTFPGWEDEGSAEWASSTAMLDLTGLADAGFWPGNFESVPKPLFARSYDAIAFYSHLDEVGIDPWAAIKAILTARASPAAFAASGAESSDFLDTWAAGILRKPSDGPEWDIHGPGLPADDEPAPVPVSIAVGSTQSLSAVPYSVNLYSVSVSSDIVTFEVNGHARISDGTIDEVIDGSAQFCTNKETRCAKCPTATEPEMRQIEKKIDLAVSAGPGGTNGSVKGSSCEVWVHYDRAGSPGLTDGRILDLVSCDGPYGHWTGTMLAGGIDDGEGFQIPFAPMPIDFTVGGSGTRTVSTNTSGVVQTPLNNVNVAWQIAITIDGATMNYVATPDPPSPGLIVTFPPMTIEAAPAGRCP